MDFTKIVIRTAIFILLVFLTSCVDLLNVITINPDKSGTSFVGMQVNAIGGLISLSGEDLQDEVKNSIVTFPSQAAKDLSTIKGIHNIKTYTTLALGKVGVEFDFDNPKALNKAYYKLFGKEKKWYYPKLISISNHKVKTRNITPFINHYFDKNESMLTESDLLKYLKFTTVIKTPSEIKTSSVQLGDLSNDKKELRYSISMKKILNESVSTANSFKY
jgi:hypothetical protein